MKIHFLILALALVAASCSKQEDKKLSSPSPITLITTTQAKTQALEIVEHSIGSIEGLIDPNVSAEVGARVIGVKAHAGQAVKKGQLIAVLDPVDIELDQRQVQADIRRIEALLENQSKTVERTQRLIQKNFISRNALDEASAQKESLQQQLEGAQAKLASVQHDQSKTRITSPIDGFVQKQIVSPGDYVKVGEPLFQLIGTHRLRAHLPFPENAGSKLHPGQTVRLTTPTVPGQTLTTTIKELKPLIETSSRAIDVIADIADQPGWQSGASVNGDVILGTHEKAIVVPETSLVLRPAGEVIYVIHENIASQRIVHSGYRQQGWVEIIDGLTEGEIIAVDGAGFLTDKAPIKVSDPAKP